MKCILCEQIIENYNAEFHQLVIDDQHTVNICEACTRKVMKWQSEKLAQLFPTRMMKKRHRREN